MLVSSWLLRHPDGLVPPRQAPSRSGSGSAEGLACRNRRCSLCLPPQGDYSQPQLELLTSRRGQSHQSPVTNQTERAIEK